MSMPRQDIEDLEAEFLATLTPDKAREFSLKMEEVISERNKQYAETQMSQFRDDLKAMDDASLLNLSRALDDIARRIMQIRNDKPDEKMIIAVYRYEELGVISEMLERQFRKNEALRCSVGRIDKITLRHSKGKNRQPDSIVQRLNDPSNDLAILLLSAGEECWWGFNMQGASSLFLSEPIWSHAAYQRLLGSCVQRLGQTKPCTVYDYAKSCELAELVRIMSQVF